MSAKQKNAPRPLVSTRAQDVDARARLLLALQRAMGRAGVYLRPKDVEALAGELHREGVCFRSWAEKELNELKRREGEERSA